MDLKQENKSPSSAQEQNSSCHNVQYFFNLLKTNQKKNIFFKIWQSPLRYFLNSFFFFFNPQVYSSNIVESKGLHNGLEYETSHECV